MVHLVTHRIRNPLVVLLVGGRATVEEAGIGKEVADRLEFELESLEVLTRTVPMLAALQPS